MWSAWGFHVPSLTSIFTRLFAKSASFYNPLIYFGLSSKFRKDVGVLLPCAREGKDSVRLKRYKHIKGKGEGPLPDVMRHRPRGVGQDRHGLGHQITEKKPQPGQELINPAPSPDSGVGSRPPTPPPANREVFFIEVPQASEGPEYECDRL